MFRFPSPVCGTLRRSLAKEYTVLQSNGWESEGNFPSSDSSPDLPDPKAQDQPHNSKMDRIL